MLHVLTGDDDYSIRQALQKIKDGIGDASALMTNTTVLDGRQVTAAELRNACQTVPFLSDKRLVIVEGLLERFEGRARGNRRKSAGRNGETGDSVQFVETVKNLPEFTELVIIGGPVKATNPMFRTLSTVTRLQVFPVLRGRDLSRWIEERVKKAGASISPQALSWLVRFAGTDLWITANEVDKLVTYAGGRRIEETDVRELVSSAQEASIFSMVDAVLESRTNAAQQLLQQVFKQGAAPAQVLVMISRQARIILLVKEMRSRGKSRGEIQSRLGLTAEFLLNKAWEQADRYSPAKLRELYHKLLDTDLAIKTGWLEGELALNSLVAELGQTVRR